jgi:predicted enzyme related to lactoylglutathione lyase
VPNQIGHQHVQHVSVQGKLAGSLLFTPDGHEDRIGTFFNGSFACDNVEATWRQLSQRGVEFTVPPTSQPWGTYARFRDSEGNTFVLSSS